MKTYLHDGLDVLSDGSNSFLHGAGIDEPLSMSKSSETLSYLQDHLGSTTRLMDASTGALKARYDYTSYGDLEDEDAGLKRGNPYTYTGREDDGTGLYYYRARYKVRCSHLTDL